MVHAPEHSPPEFKTRMSLRPRLAGIFLLLCSVRSISYKPQLRMLSQEPFSQETFLAQVCVWRAQLRATVSWELSI